MLDIKIDPKINWTQIRKFLFPLEMTTKVITVMLSTNKY